MATEEVQSQEHQINAAVVGRGVRLELGEPLDETAEPVHKRKPLFEREALGVPPIYQHVRDRNEEMARPLIQEVDQADDPTSAGAPKQNRRKATVEPEDIAMMEESPKTKRKKESKKPLTKGQKLLAGAGLIGVCIIAASNLIPKDGTSQAPQAQTAPVPQTAAPMPSEPATLMMQLTPDEMELLKAARLQKTKESSDAARAANNDGPLPAELSSVPVGESDPLASFVDGTIASTAPVVKPSMRVAKPGAEMPSAAPAPKPQPESKPKLVDKNTATMDVPLTQDPGIPSDIAELREVAERSKNAPPVAKLAAPLEESKASTKSAKIEAKQEPSLDSKTPAADLLQKQPTAAVVSVKPEAPSSKKMEAEPAKKVAVKQVEKPKSIKPAKVQNDQPRAKSRTEESEEDFASGYALPIREIHANGRPVVQTKPVTREPTKTTLAEPKPSSRVTRSAPEIMHVDVAYGLVTNPTTQLPIRVKVGDVLPNGAVVSGFDPVKGVINTSRGSYGMK